MSDVPGGEIASAPNSPVEIKKRTAAAVIRLMQEVSPGLDKIRLMTQEVADVVDVHGTVTDEDLAALGVSAATLTSLVAFMTKLTEFMDSSTQTRKSYRTAINSVRRVGAQV